MPVSNVAGCYDEPVTIKHIALAIKEAQETPEGQRLIRDAFAAIRSNKIGRPISWKYCADCKLYFAAQDLKNNRTHPHGPPYTAEPVKKLPA